MSDTQTFTQLGEFIEQRMAELEVPGVAVGVIHGADQYTAAFGLTSVENPLPVDTATLFQIGSTTKTITGTAAMRLVEQGLLDLDAPVRTYLPGLRLADESVAQRVTLRHLFTHSSGWVGDVFDDTGMGDDALAKMVAQMADIPQLTPLGHIYSYNNAGYYLAGRIIEIVTGETYEAAARRLVLDPLGMTRSFFFPGEIMTYRFAAGHYNTDAGPEVARPWPLARNANPVGGLSSSVTDQLRYARFHIGDGTTPNSTRLLSQASMQAMQTPHFPMDSFGAQRGITWELRDIGNVRTVAHGGGTNGHLSAFRLAPDHQFAITVLTNADRGAQLHTEAVQWAFAHFLSAQEPTREPLTLADNQLAAYAGYYQGGLADAEIYVENGGLMLRSIPTGGFPLKDSPAAPPAPPVRLALVAETLAIALDPPFKDAKAEFVRDPDGSIGWFHFGGRIRQRRASNP